MTVFPEIVIKVVETTVEGIRQIDSPDISASTSNGRTPTNHPYWLPYLVGLIIFMFCFLAVVDLLIKYYWCERRRRKQEALEQEEVKDTEKGLFLEKETRTTPLKPELTSVTYKPDQLYKPRVHKLRVQENGLPMIHEDKKLSTGKHVKFSGHVTKL